MLLYTTGWGEVIGSLEFVLSALSENDFHIREPMIALHPVDKLVDTLGRWLLRFLSGLYNRQDWQGILDMEETALLTACAINLGTSGSVPDREASVYYWLGLAHERLAQQLSVEGVDVCQHHHTVHTRRLTDRYTETLAHLCTERERERERERDRQTDTHANTHTHARAHTHT